VFLRFSDGTVLDYEFNFLRGLVDLVDARLAELEEDAVDSGDPDQFGILDSMEHLIGFGFVACQRYVTATSGDLRIAKTDALDAGPVHDSGYSFAALVNHAANYWKHAEEWSPGMNERIWDRILTAVVAVAGENSDYPLMSFLVGLTSSESYRFGPLLERLEEWRDALIAIKDGNTG
jgi:hypothetical protein